MQHIAYLYFGHELLFVFSFPINERSLQKFPYSFIGVQFWMPGCCSLSLSPPLFIAQNLTPRDAKTPSLLPHTTRGTREGIGKAQDSHPWRL
jgi:hypothetical protein